MPSSKPLSFWWVRLLLLCSFALGSTTYAQPSYEEDMARQRAQERQIMEDGIRQGAEAAQQSDYQQSTPHRWVSNHIAVAWHPDVMDVWASWQQDSKQAAEADALGACTAYMGPGCTIASSGYNISIAVSQGPDGFLFVAWGETKAKAKKNSLDQCGRPNCINKHLFSVEAAWLPVDEFMHHYPPLHTYFPQPKEKYRYGLVGWPKSVVDPKWQGKAWLITGSDNFESAKNKMLTKCKQDTGSDCDVFMTSGSTHLIHYLNNSTGIASWAVDFSKAEAEKQMTKACKKAKEKCSILNSYDAITPRDLIIDSPITRVRGYLAIAWPKKTKADEKLVVSTGHDELSTAKATALKECQKVNQAECTLVDENLDDGTYTHLGLYLDEKKSLRWYFGFNEKAIEKTAASDCTGCKMTAMLDARKKKNLVKNLAL